MLKAAPSSTRHRGDPLRRRGHRLAPGDRREPGPDRGPARTPQLLRRLFVLLHLAQAILRRQYPHDRGRGRQVARRRLQGSGAGLRPRPSRHGCSRQPAPLSRRADERSARDASRCRSASSASAASSPTSTTRSTRTGRSSPTCDQPNDHLTRACWPARPRRRSPHRPRAAATYTSSAPPSGQRHQRHATPAATPATLHHVVRRAGRGRRVLANLSPLAAWQRQALTTHNQERLRPCARSTIMNDGGRAPRRDQPTRRHLCPVHLGQQLPHQPHHLFIGESRPTRRTSGCQWRCAARITGQRLGRIVLNNLARPSLPIARCRATQLVERRSVLRCWPDLNAVAPELPDRAADQDPHQAGRQGDHRRYPHPQSAHAYAAPRPASIGTDLSRARSSSPDRARPPKTRRCSRRSPHR